jgi:dTDP-glucose pyrophosphorylase
MKIIKQYIHTINKESPVQNALKMLNKTKYGIVIALDNKNRVCGTLTDGDIRRGLLKEKSLNEPVKEFMQESFIWVYEDSSLNEKVGQFNDNPIEQLLVLSKDRSLLGIYLRPTNLFKQDSKAFILAGGMGKRLGNLTKETPKPMIVVHNKPILEWIIRALVRDGIAEIYLSVNYKSSKIKDYFLDGKKFDCSIEYIEEKEPLGTAGSLSLIDDPFNDLIILNGDLLTNLNYKNLIKFHKKNHAEITVCTRDYKHMVPFGVIDSIDADRIVGIVEKPEVKLNINAGVYIIKSEIKDLVKSNSFLHITDLINKSILQGYKVISFPLHEKWIDIGRPEELEKAQLEKYF